MNSGTDTIRTAVSRLRGIYKIEKEDAFVTDRFLYSLITKYGALLIRRKSMEKKLMNNQSLFQWLPKVDLIEVDKIEADCVGIKTHCTFMRTKYPLPPMFENDKGPIIKQILSIDSGEKIEETTLMKFISMIKSPNFKYNKTKYYYVRPNGHVYFPNITWSMVTLEALFKESVSGYCIEEEDCSECDDNRPYCKLKQDDELPYPQDLLAEIENMIRQDLGMKAQIPSDTQDNALNVMR